MASASPTHPTYPQAAAAVVFSCGYASLVLLSRADAARVLAKARPTRWDTLFVRYRVRMRANAADANHASPLFTLHCVPCVFLPVLWLLLLLCVWGALRAAKGEGKSLS